MGSKSKSPPASPEQWHGCYDTPRDGLFTRESNRHPAKMAVGLCFRILEHGERMGYWKRGDMILDPMAGIGTTLCCAAVSGYSAVGVELEQHFIDLCWENIQANAKRANLAGGRFLKTWHDGEQDGLPFGILRGDARELPAVLSSTGIPACALTSPPYPSEFREQHPGTEGGTAGLKAQCGGSFRGYADGGIVSPPYGDLSVLQGAGVTHRVLKVARKQGMDAAVKLYRETVMDRLKAHGRWSDENIRHHIELALASAEAGGYGAVISSPAYGGRDDHGTDPHPERMDGPGTMFRGYRPPLATGHSSLATESQIGNLRDPKGDIDAVLSSPPWEDQSRGGLLGFADPAAAAAVAAERYKNGKRKGHRASAAAIERAMRQDDAASTYGQAPGQIGQTRGETYCAAMLRVYRGMAAVLKPGGVVALVTKDPIKNGKRRDLAGDTIRLMAAAGFELLERKRAMLAVELPGQYTLAGELQPRRRERKSFFKRLFEQKRPDLRVDWEDVLFFRLACPPKPKA